MVDKQSVIDIVRKAAYLGAGMFSVSAGAMADMARKIARDAGMSAAEGKMFVDDIMEKRAEYLGQATAAVKMQVETILKNLDIPSRSDVREINERLDRVENGIGRLER